MTKKEAISKAREYETENLSWDESMEMWYERNNPLNQSELKLARIARAYTLLGMDHTDAQYEIGCHPEQFEGMTFREAVYRYQK